MKRKIKNNIRFSILGEISRLIKTSKRKKRWHHLHPESDTIPMTEFEFNHVQIGKGSYGELNIVDFGGTCKLIIGNYVSIAQNVTFLLNAEHFSNHISTYPFKVKTLETTKSESFGKGDITVADDVWIGYGAIILSGVNIGQGAIVGAGAVVTKDVPPYAIVGGNPARILNYRFNKEIISELMKIDFERLSKDDIASNLTQFYMNIDNVEQVEKITVHLAK